MPTKKTKDFRHSKNSENVGKKLGVLILAGGFSKRIAGKKALLKISGKPMIQHVAERASSLSEELVISYKTGGKELKKVLPGAQLVLDKWDEKGALTGIRSASPTIKSEYVALLACDCPFIKPEVIKILFKAAIGHDGAILSWPNGRIEPLQAVYRTKSLRRATEQAWKSGKMSVRAVLQGLDVVYLNPEELKEVDPELLSFININSPDDISRLQRGFRLTG